MKLVRRIVSPVIRWYRYTVFVSGLRSFEGDINVRGTTYLWNDNVSIGSGTNVYQGVTLWGKGVIDIGNNVEVGINTVIYSSNLVKIGNNSLIAADCYIIDSNHGIAKDNIIREQASNSPKCLLSMIRWQMQQPKGWSTQRI